MEELRGLTEDEVLARRKRGEGNDVHLPTSRSYASIIRQNLFSFINIVLFAIGIVLVLVGRAEDAVVSVVIILLNVILGLYQEIRAKRQLDRIALLTRPKVTALRNGIEKDLDPSEVVQGDILLAHPGDQFVVDGVVLGDGMMEVDEALLTGESDLVQKQDGDEVLSGSYCVSGSAAYEATRVGLSSHANQVTTGARAFRVVNTPLQQDIDFIIRLLTISATIIGLLLLLSSILVAIPLMRSVQMAAVIAGLVPNGLFLMLVVAYAMGALRIVRRGALVQQSNSVESLSYVNILCLDKTGTITANRIELRDVLPLGIDKKHIESVLGDFSWSVSAANRTSEAIREAFPGRERSPVDEVPFSSERKWSAIAFEDADMCGVYVLGAPEVLEPLIQLKANSEDRIRSWSGQGLRVLIFAHNSHVTHLHDPMGEPQLPDKLTPLGIISFSDELRPALHETLVGFGDAGVQLKIISGDHPQTVAALVKQAGLPVDGTAVVSGSDLARMNEDDFYQAAERGTIFGRITPSQKEQLVDSLRDHGYYVAMVGDGVNDVLSLKKANLGIAMQSGSGAARGVADMVLLEDSFGVLPHAFQEGQRIVHGMQDILRLFLTRAFYFLLLIIATGMIGIGFPFVPKHATILTFFTVGIPTFALAIWARPRKVDRHAMIPDILRFIIPAAIFTFLFGVLVYSVAFGITYEDVLSRESSVTREEIEGFRASAGIDYEITSTEEFAREFATLISQSALTTFTLLAGLLLIIFVEPPSDFFVGGDVYSGDLRPTFLAAGLLTAFIVVLVIEPLREFFELLLLSGKAYGVIIGTVILWMLILRQAWRGRWLERFLHIDSTKRTVSGDT
ncbi:MAG: HAD-IC family P-type ATPase [Anaerolineales bacterium]|nr:HAD-IC family P-type ATPase [Anaerolineales bacterium]